MEMQQAMKKCKAGGFVARNAYPNRKYFKSCEGVFLEARPPFLNRIDFMAGDWEPHDPAAIEVKS